MPTFIQRLISFIIFTITVVHSKDTILFTEDTLEDSHGRIIYSSVIFRHGERSPSKQYPTDPYKSEFYWSTYWPQGKKKSSMKSKLQMYDLGKWFRKRYDFLINEKHKNAFFKLHSSETARAVISAKCFLAGFISWTDDRLKFQPVQIRIIPRQRDKMIGYKMKCERFDEEKNIINWSPGMRESYFKYQEVFHYIRIHSGFNISSNNIFEAFINAFYLHDSLFIEQSNNLTLPAWTDLIYPEPLHELAGFSLSNIAYSHQMRRIKAGFLIRKLIEEMELKVQGKLNETVHFYSGHESTIAGLLTALEIFNLMVPPVATSVIIDLRRKNKDYIVTVLYRNSTTAAPYLLQLPGSEYICTLENFKKWTKKLIPTTWQEECALEKNH